MIEPEYTLLATSTEPTFDLENVDLEGGDHLLVVQASDGTEVSAYSDAAVYSQEHSEYVIQKTTLTDIANSVRNKSGKTASIPVKDIATEINSLYGSGKAPSGTSPTIKSNGKHNVADYAIADVQVPLPSGQCPDIITKNGEYNITDYETVKVDVPVPNGYIIPENTLTITANGTHSVIPYASVNVDVPPVPTKVDVLPTKNIKKNAFYLCGGKYYKYGKVVKDMIMVDDAGAVSTMSDFCETYDISFNFYYVSTKPTENIMVTTPLEEHHYYYVEDESSFCDYVFDEYTGDAGAYVWRDSPAVTIRDASEATEEGTYALIEECFIEYINLYGTYTIAENGTHDVSSFASVTVDVKPPLEEKTITENGEYTPSEDNYGFSKVTVSLPGDEYIESKLTVKFKSKLDFSTIYDADMQKRFPSGIYYRVYCRDQIRKIIGLWFKPEGLMYVIEDEPTASQPEGSVYNSLAYDASTNKWLNHSGLGGDTFWFVKDTRAPTAIPATLYRWLELNAELTQE